MRVGIVGTGAIANKHADSYREIGYELVAASNRSEQKGRDFSKRYGVEFVPDYGDLCRRPDIDFIDVCAFPDSRLAIAREGFTNGKHVLVQKPIALKLEEAREMIRLAEQAGLQLGVVSQYRFGDAVIFLRKAIQQGRLGRIVEADTYCKWHRPQAYYDRPGKGAWDVEGGGALINQAIHGIDLLLYLAGPAREVYADWQLAAAHTMESEDVINALVRYENGATGVIQASTAILPGYPERTEIHGTKGSAIVSGDKLIAWDVQGDAGDDAPLVKQRGESGASDPMAISIEPFKRQFLDFGDAIRNKRRPVCSGEDGYRALQLVLAAYESARSGKKVGLG